MKVIIFDRKNLSEDGGKVKGILQFTPPTDISRVTLLIRYGYRVTLGTYILLNSPENRMKSVASSTGLWSDTDTQCRVI